MRLDMQVCPNLDILVPALVEGGIDELEKRCNLTPGGSGLLASCVHIILWLSSSQPCC